MSKIADQIYREVSQLPENLAQEVYDFLRFLEHRHGLDIPTEVHSVSGAADWQSFFDQHVRTVEDAQPLTRDEI